MSVSHRRVVDLPVEVSARLGIPRRAVHVYLLSDVVDGRVGGRLCNDLHL